MKRQTIILASVAILLGLPLVFLLGKYGTLSPCGMLKKDLRAAMMKMFMEETSKPSQNPWEQAGKGLGMMLGTAMAGPMIDSMVEGMGPFECAKAVVRWNLQAGDPFAKATPGSEAPSGSVPASPQAPPSGKIAGEPGLLAESRRLPGVTEVRRDGGTVWVGMAQPEVGSLASWRGHAHELANAIAGKYRTLGAKGICVRVDLTAATDAWAKEYVGQNLARACTDS